MGSHLSISVWTRGGVQAVVKEEIFVFPKIELQLYFGQLPLLLQSYVTKQLAGMVTVTLTFLPSSFDYYQMLSQNCGERLLASFYLSVCPHETTRRSLDGY